MEQIIKKIEAEKLIVILRGIKKEHLINVTNAMYEGGVKLLEITYSANGSVSDEETAENIKLLHDAFGDKMSIGAGTVLTEKQVRLTKEAGGEFIISPDCNKEITFIKTLSIDRATSLLRKPSATIRII